MKNENENEYEYDVKLFSVPDEFIKRKYVYDESLPKYRTEFMRDRDRVLYSTAFRRLAGKTQIYTVGSDDHKRNRLTHSLEVSQIARTIAIGLGFNEYLTEAIALAHDFGHTPFGHAGEQMLNEIMLPETDYIKNSPFSKSRNKMSMAFERECEGHENYVEHAFGFKHNLQSVRVCVCLEDSYRGSNHNNIGLNLTNYTLFGIMIHSKLKYKSDDEYPNYLNDFDELLRQKKEEEKDKEKEKENKGEEKNKEEKANYAWSFEAFIVALSDEVAQWHHDLEDALRGQAIPLSKITDTIGTVLEETLSDEDKKCINDIKKTQITDRKTVTLLSHIVINNLVNDIIDHSKKNLNTLYKNCNNSGITTSTQFFNKFDFDSKEVNKVISLSKKIKTDEFEKIIKSSVHHSKNVERMNEKGKYIIRKIFEAYYAHPQQLPDGIIKHILIDTNYKSEIVEIIKDENEKSDKKIEGPKDFSYNNIDEVAKRSCGLIRVDFDELIRNPNIWVKCILMRRICDHIASMTDHYAIEEFKSLYG